MIDIKLFQIVGYVLIFPEGFFFIKYLVSIFLLRYVTDRSIVIFPADQIRVLIQTPVSQIQDSIRWLAPWINISNSISFI